MTLAQTHGIPYKLDIYPFHGSDAEAALRAGGDYRIGLMGPGVDALLASTQLLLVYLLDERR